MLNTRLVNDGLVDDGPVDAQDGLEIDWMAVARALAADQRGPWAAVNQLALAQGFVVTRTQARRLGVPDATVRSFVRRGRWQAVRRGVLCVVPADVAPGPLHEIDAAAAALLYRRSVVSHASAAVLDGLPLLSPPRCATLTAGRRQDARSFDRIRVHTARLANSDVATWFGCEVAGAARTIVDLARNRGVPDGLVAADYALHEGLTSVPALHAVLARQSRWPGITAARRVVDLADGRAESVLESLTRLCVIDAGLPAPEPQVWVKAQRHWYRIDLMWPATRVIVEADGLLKYRDKPHALTEEKRRQEHLERAGFTVVRVLWEDVTRQPAETIARIQAALTADALLTV